MFQSLLLSVCNISTDTSLILLSILNRKKMGLELWEIINMNSYIEFQVYIF